MSAFSAADFQAARRGAFGADLRAHARLGSTQDAARQALAGGAGEGCVVLAEVQDAGRGRWGNRWQAAPGSSLLFTVALAAPPPAAGPTLPLALGLATALALRGLGLAEARVKWPNDLLWRDRKLGGLLAEQAGGWILAGCGLNLTQVPSDWSPDLRGRAASLREAGLEKPREAVLAAVLASWEAVLARWRGGGFEALRPDWEALDALAGRDCRVQAGGETLQGRVLGVAADGALRLGLADARERRLLAAEAQLLRPAGAD